MNFPIQHCLETKHLNFSTYCLLMTNLVTEGYNKLSNFDLSQTFNMWRYLGVNQFGDIQLFDHPWGYLHANAWWDYDGDEESYPNILNKEWLDSYLGGQNE